MNSLAPVEQKCRICGLSDLREFVSFRTLRQVTSDSRSWKAGGRLTICDGCGSAQKLASPEWLDDIRDIYQSYAIYHQAGGNEQPIFRQECSAPLPRSLALTHYLERKVAIPGSAQVLDFGCGSGAALKTYASLHPQWVLYGAELSTQNLASLQAIPGFAELFTCPPDELPRQFDLITAFHALEHVLDPVGTLRSLASRLTTDGVLFVQVPDAGRNPYDLVIADHLLHFTRDTLGHAAVGAGCNIVELTDAVLPKELSLIAAPGRNLRQAPSPVGASGRSAEVAAQIAWLVAQVEAAVSFARDGAHFGLFGTSISATWLAGYLEDRVSFFVDEDKGRIGRRHMGKPVLAPAEIPNGADVYVPLIPDIAALVAQRLSRPGVSFHEPPPLGGRFHHLQMVD
jgi:SAM-dependent methyltransferase